LEFSGSFSGRFLNFLPKIINKDVHLPLSSLNSSESIQMISALMMHLVHSVVQQPLDLMKKMVDLDDDEVGAPGFGGKFKSPAAIDEHAAGGARPRADARL